MLYSKRRIHLTSISLFALCLSAASIQAAINVVLIGGQSNADGRALTSGLPTSLQSPQNDTDYFYRVEGGPAAGTLTTIRPGSPEFGGGTFHGPEITLASSLNASILSGDGLAVIKYGNGGTTLGSNWLANGDTTTNSDGTDYQFFQTTVSLGKAALEMANPGEDVNIVGMVWMQGESDTNSDTFTSSYESNLNTFVTDIRANYGADLPFVIGSLSTAQTGLNSTRLNSIRLAQNAVANADANTYYVETNSFGLKTDNLHFDSDGQQAMGSAFAAQLIASGAFDTVPEPSSSGLVALGGLMVLLHRRKLVNN